MVGEAVIELWQCKAFSLFGLLIRTWNQDVISPFRLASRLCGGPCPSALLFLDESCWASEKDFSQNQNPENFEAIVLDAVFPSKPAVSST